MTSDDVATKLADLSADVQSLRHEVAQLRKGLAPVLDEVEAFVAGMADGAIRRGQAR